MLLCCAATLPGLRSRASCFDAARRERACVDGCTWWQQLTPDARTAPAKPNATWCALERRRLLRILVTPLQVAQRVLELTHLRHGHESLRCVMSKVAATWEGGAEGGVLSGALQVLKEAYHVVRAVDALDTR